MGKIIKIKRATRDGLVDAEGELFKIHGRQFCFIHTEKYYYYMIELTSGFSVITLEKQNFSKDDAISKFKRFIYSKSESDFDKAIEIAKTILCERYKFTIPVNQLIK